MDFVMPAFACIVVIFGLFKRIPVFDVFLKGAKEGVTLLYNIAPTIIGLVFAIDLLRSSGAVDAICNIIAPVAEFMGFPKEIVPMVLLRPVSGSGSTALLTSLYQDCGPDSFYYLCQQYSYVAYDDFNDIRHGYDVEGIREPCCRGYQRSSRNQ